MCPAERRASRRERPPSWVVVLLVSAYCSAHAISQGGDCCRFNVGADVHGRRGAAAYVRRRSRSDAHRDYGAGIGRVLRMGAWQAHVATSDREATAAPLPRKA